MELMLQKKMASTVQTLSSEGQDLPSQRPGGIGSRAWALKDVVSFKKAGDFAPISIIHTVYL